MWERQKTKGHMKEQRLRETVCTSMRSSTALIVSTRKNGEGPHKLKVFECVCPSGVREGWEHGQVLVMKD